MKFANIKSQEPSGGFNALKLLLSVDENGHVTTPALCLPTAETIVFLHEVIGLYCLKLGVPIPEKGILNQGAMR
jgi:hypothetical protein